MSHLVLAYAVNALWQVPLLAAAAWLTTRLLGPSLRLQHLTWIAALILAALLPLRGELPTLYKTAAPTSRSITIPVDPVAANLEAPDFPSVTERTEIPAPAPAISLPLRIISLSATSQLLLACLFLLAIVWSALRLLAAVFSLRRIVANSTPLLLPLHRQTLLRQAATSMGVSPPDVALADPPAGPLVAGLRKPRIVLPAAILETPDAEFTAALLHELAHIRRRDLHANLALKLLALPIAWHPATSLLDRRICQTREMLCDEAAAHGFPSPNAYARSLLSLSHRLLPENLAHPTLAPGLFTHPAPTLLEERIMKLIAPSTRPSFRLARLASAAAVLAGALTVASVFHLSPAVLAAQQAPAVPAPPVPAAPASMAPAPAVPEVPALPSTAPEAPALPPTASEVPALPPLAPGTPVAPAQPAAPLPPAAPHQHHHAGTDAANPHSQADFGGLADPADFKFNFKFDQKFPEFSQSDMHAFDQQMASIDASINSPEFKLQMKQLTDSIAKMQQPNSAAMRLKINKELQQNLKMLSSAEFQQHIAETQRRIVEAKLNSPEFKAKIAEASRRQADAAKQLAEASAHIAEARTHVHDATVQKELDEAQKALDQARAH